MGNPILIRLIKVEAERLRGLIYVSSNMHIRSIVPIKGHWAKEPEKRNFKNDNLKTYVDFSHEPRLKTLDIAKFAPEDFNSLIGNYFILTFWWEIVAFMMPSN